MTDAEIYRGLTDILQNIFLRDDIEAIPTMTAHDVLGWDSFKQIEVVLSTEDRFGVKFTSKEIDGLKTVGDIASLVAGKLA